MLFACFFHQRIVRGFIIPSIIYAKLVNLFMYCFSAIKKQQMKNNKKNILLVEDEKVTALSESNVLKKGGYKVIVAHNGDEAIETVNSNKKIDLILMDIDLGSGLDGTVVAETILKDYDIPIVFLSSHTEKEIVDRTRKITNYGYIVKHSGDTVLFASIDMAFKLHEAHIKLKESESRYRLLADHSSDVIWTMDLEGRLTYISPSVYGHYGITPEKAMGMSMRSYIVPEYADQFFQIIAKELKKPSNKRLPSLTVEFKQYTNAGIIVDVESNVAWILDEKGEAIGLQGSNRDITAKKFAENALRESEAKYRVIIENLYDVIYSLDLHGIVTYISPNVKRYGYELNDVLGNSMLNFVHPDDHSKVIESYNKGVDTGEGGPLNIRLFKKNGEIVWAWEAARVVRDENGKVIQIVGILRDRTDQKTALDAQREAEAKYKMIVENLYDIISVTNQEGIIQYVTPNISHYGYSQEDVLGHHLIDFVHPEDREMVIDIYLKTLQTSKIYPSDFRMILKNGGTAWAMAASRVVKDKEGNVEYVNTLLKDITKQKETEKSIRESEEQYRMLINTAPVGIFVIQDDHYVFVNPKGVDILGYSNSKEIIGINAMDIVHSDSEAVVKERKKKVAAGELNTPIELKLQRKDGSVLIVESVSVPVILQGIPSVIIIAQDITDWKKMEETQKEIEEMFRLFLEHSPIYVFF